MLSRPTQCKQLNYCDQVVLFSFIAIDQCGTILNNCDHNALCVSDIVAVKCTCQPGYSGNGTSCAGMSSMCVVFSTSFFSIYFFVFFYSLHFFLFYPFFYPLLFSNFYNFFHIFFTIFLLLIYFSFITDLFFKFVILDVNECETGTADCDEEATCKNYNGSFDCVCNKGYSGNGKKGKCFGMNYCFSFRREFTS